MTTDSRIESLETQVRTLKRMLLGVFALVVVGGLLAATNLQSVPDVVKAKKFIVVDAKGDAATVLDSRLMLNTPGGLVGVINGSFAVFNEKGRELLQLQSNSPYAGTAGELVLLRADGTQFISMLHQPGDESQPGSGIIRITNDKNKLVSTLP